MEQNAGVKTRTLRKPNEIIESMFDGKFLCKNCMSIRFGDNKLLNYAEAVFPKPTVSSQDEVLATLDEKIASSAAKLKSK